MKKALIIANMLFASATVFGMKSYRDVSQESRENSMHLLSANDDYELAKELQEQEAIYDSMRILQLEDNNQSEKAYQSQQAEEAEFQKAPAESEEAELQRVKENSLLTLVTDAKNRDVLERAITESKEEYQLQQAIEKLKLMSIAPQKNKNDSLKQSKIKELYIESESLLNTFISEKQPYDRKPEELSNVSVLVNPGKYTLQTLHMLRNQDIYTFVQHDHGSSFNELGNQCAILALDVDEFTMRRLQQLKIVRNTEGAILYLTEEDNIEGVITTLGEYIQPRGGLSSDQAVIWEKIAEILKCRIDIFEFPNQGEDAQKIYHIGGQLYMISSYGTQFKKVKRLRLDSDPKGEGGHYTELRIFNKDGSQVK
ncbi:MAG: hypothetical protein J6S86_01645 [Alphaproteobacteria bacterium]|nr:hypothetical protein [Alphaproteobacteria bacterium]